MAEAKCILVTRVCVCVCLCVYLSLPAFAHYCTDLDVTWGMVVSADLHYLAELQLVHGFRCYENIVPNAKCQRVLVLALCMVDFLHQHSTARYCYTVHHMLVLCLND